MRQRLASDHVENLPPPPAGAVRLSGLAGPADFVAKASPELAANALVCAVNQAAYLLKRQIESQGRAFLKEGGFTENLYRQRIKARGQGIGRPSDRSDKSDMSDKSDRPACPKSERWTQRLFR